MVYIGVPSNYDYNPSHGPLHDFCTVGADSYGDANFKGPCAYHDLCYGGPYDKKSCDAIFSANLDANCEDNYGAFNPHRYSCKDVAATYVTVVVVAN